MSARLAVGLLLTLAVTARAEGPTTEEKADLAAKLMTFQQQLSDWKPAPAARDAEADVFVCAKAVDWLLRHDEFYKPADLAAAQKVLETGASRLASAKEGKFPWRSEPGSHVLGYRSNVDKSVQPFAVTFPPNYDPNAMTRWPVQVVLHGRNGNLHEVSFFQQHDGKTPKEHAAQTWVQLDVFGRTNNAYRWAGETDVFEALSALRRVCRIDDHRVTLWGFSMGGAGAWHLGLHYPDRWSSVGAGAGFVDTVEYLGLKAPLSPLHQRLIHIYDAVDYVENAANIPIIGYGGELDKQLLAASTMHRLGQERGVEIPLLVGPGVEHKWPPDSFREFQAFHARHTETGRPRYPAPSRIRFVTWTLKYNQCDWVTILEQQTPYEQSIVEAQVHPDDDVLEVSTTNVVLLSLSRDVAEFVRIDGGDPLPLRSAADGLLPSVDFEKVGDTWRGLDYRASRQLMESPGLRKRHDLQGPIDDAFMEPFLVVEPTGSPWHASHAEYTTFVKDRFLSEFDKWLRGRPPVIQDNRLSDEDIADNNLILFGDPGSNAVLARIVRSLPLRWIRDEFSLDNQNFAPANSAVAMIFPNPLNPRRYVVINSGHTFHEAEFKASNATLYPRLGDIAVIGFERRADGTFSETILLNEIFNSRWGLPDTSPDQ